MGKGEKLNNRIWQLFEKAGFITKPNSNDSQEHEISLGQGNHRTVDLLATETELRVRILGSNKARGNSMTESISVHIHDVAELMQVDRADAAILVMTEKSVDDKKRRLALTKNIHIWGPEEIDYFEAVANAVGHYAKYEIVHSLGLRTKEEKLHRTVLALKISQPTLGSKQILYLFNIPADFLLKTSVVIRRASGSRMAYQRMVQEKRLAKIRDFVSRNSSLLPTNVIVHFDKSVREFPIDVSDLNSSGNPISLTDETSQQLVVLSMPQAYASMELIDGQHRLYGFAKTEPATRKDFNLVVVGLKGLTEDRRRETFIAINDNARRVDANLVALLKLTDDETELQKDPELMAIALVNKLNNPATFGGRIRMLDTGNKRITLKGFAGYDLKGLVGENGELRKYYPNNSDKLLSPLRLYFNLLKTTFPDQWENPDKYIIFTNRGISAFLKLLKSILKVTEKPLDPKVLSSYFYTLQNRWRGSWETQKLASAYVGSKGWKDFHDKLVRTIRKEHAEFRKLK